MSQSHEKQLFHSPLHTLVASDKSFHSHRKKKKDFSSSSGRSSLTRKRYWQKLELHQHRSQRKETPTGDLWEAQCSSYEHLAPKMEDKNEESSHRLELEVLKYLQTKGGMASPHTLHTQCEEQPSRNAPEVSFLTLQRNVALSSRYSTQRTTYQWVSACLVPLLTFITSAVEHFVPTTTDKEAGF